MAKTRKKSNNDDDSPASHTRGQGLKRRSIHDKQSPASSPRNSRKSKDKSPGDSANERLYPQPDLPHTENESKDDVDGHSENSRENPQDEGRNSEINRNRANQRDNSHLSYFVLILRLIILVLSVVCLLLVVVCLLSLIGQDNNPSSDLKTATALAERFVKEYKSLKLKFPSQDRRLWQVVGSAIKRVLTDDPATYPAVILLAVPQGGAMTATCLSRHVVQLVNTLFDIEVDVVVNCSRLTQLSPAKTKLELDKSLQDILPRSRGVVLDDFHRLPAQGALLMHGYCDGDNAPFKNATIVQVLQMDEQPAHLTERDVEAYLNRLWESELGVDEMPALRSRIANNIAIVTPEKDIVCNN